MPDLTTQILTTREGLAAMRAPWRDLLAQHQAPSPFAGPAWFEGYLDHKLESGARWLVVSAWRGGRLLGVLPLVACDERPRTLRVPGEYFTHDGPPVLMPGSEQQVLARLTDTAFAAHPDTTRVAIAGLREGTVLHDQLRHMPHGVLRRDGEGARMPVEGTLDDLHHRIGKNMWRNLRKAGNRIARECGGEAHYEILQGADACPEIIEEIATLEASGWKGEDGGALGTARSNLRLYRDLAQAWSDAGTLEWHRLRVGDQLAALHMAVRIGTTLTMVRISYEEDLSRYSPSGLLLLHVLEREHERGQVCELDFVEYNAWQDRWHMEETSYHRLCVYRAGIVGTLLGYAPDLVSTRLRESDVLRSSTRRLRS